MLLFPIVGLVTYWGIQFIWLIPAFLVPSVAALLHKQYLKTIENENLSMILLFVALIACALSILVPIISTIIQFWGVVVWSLGGLILLIVAAVLISVYKNNKAKNRKKTELEAKQEQEKQDFLKSKKLKKEEEAEQQRIQRQKAEQEENLKISRLKEELLVNIERELVYSWEQVYNLYRKDTVPKEILLYLPIETIENFFKVSKTKNKITFNGSILSFMMIQYKGFFDSSMDDAELLTIKTKIESIFSYIRQFEKFEGYDAIIKIILQNLGKDFIDTLKIFDKKFLVIYSAHYSK